MAPLETYREIANNNSHRRFTFSEAIEFMKYIDKQHTDINTSVSWRNIKTGKQVSIGYT